MFPGDVPEREQATIVYSGTKNARMVGARDWQSRRAPSTQVVRKAYTNARAHDININQGSQLRAETEKLLSDGGRYPGDSMYDDLTRFLRSKDLTINFNAHVWFSTPNNYQSYIQMYEKAINKETGEMLLSDADPLNPALDRVMADTHATFPAQWHGPERSSPYNRGLNPRFVGKEQRIMGRMHTGEMVGAGSNQQGHSQYKGSNKLFNPKTKQVFAALNYGSRPHGSSTTYGMSYFQLKQDFKVNAIYFAGDTFLMQGASAQVSYQMLGAIYSKATPTLRNQIWNTWLYNMRLGDLNAADPMDLLLEAHIFDEVRFSDIFTMVLCPRYGDGTEYDGDTQIRVKANAQDFCARWGIQHFLWNA
jgi:hypothetical protein